MSKGDVNRIMAAVSSNVQRVVEKSVKQAMQHKRYDSPPPAKRRKHRSDFYGPESGESEGEYSGEETYSEYSDDNYSEVVFVRR